MSDPCYLEINFHKKDLKQIEEILCKAWHWDETSSEEIWDETYPHRGVNEITATIGAANYALYSELKLIAKAGIQFHGFHGKGDEYNSCLFSTNNKKVFYILCDNECNMLVTCDVKGEPLKHGLEDIQYYLQGVNYYERNRST